MIVQDQSDVICFMNGPAIGGINGKVETIETHISMIFLAGDRAFKMKRAVDLPYVNFSTPQRRLKACEEEVVRNSRTAPGLYLGVRRITLSADGQLAFDGSGLLVDAVVEMVRFGQEQLFDQMADAGQLNADMMAGVASMIAEFHADAPVVHSTGGKANIAGVLDINEAGFATSSVFPGQEVAMLNSLCRKALDGHAELLDRRETQGKVRICHGDLHLRNICLLDGKPRLFDCIEFNDQIATIDTLYDLAFLLMDLWHRDLKPLANLVMNRYLDETGDDSGFVLLPFFMAVRAAVRAHVLATQVDEGSRQSSSLVKEAKSYFDLAISLLAPSRPGLIAIGGLSGSGKTTVAEILACTIGAPPGARILESDRTRKSMHGVSAMTRLPPEAYRPEISRKVYADLAARSRMILSAGGSIIAEAVFERRNDRDQIRQAALETQVPASIVWLEAGAETLKNRVESRIASPSDADRDVLASQLAHHVDVADWHKIDAEQEPQAIALQIAALHAGAIKATSPKT